MKKLLLTAAILACTAGAANAAEEGWYLGLGAGWNHANDASFERAGVANEASYDEDWIGQAAIGYAWGNDWRTEVEGSYRSNEIDGLSGTGTTTEKNGDFRSWSAMANAIYDFSNDSAWTPYVGGGIGASFQNADNIGNAFAANTNIDKKDMVLAYQAIGGLDYDMTAQSKLGVRYVYHTSEDGEFETNAGANRNTDGEYENHSVLLTYRMSFGTPDAAPAATAAMAPRAPVAAPVRAPAPVQQPMPVRYAVPSEAVIEASPYKVFFDNNSAVIGASGRQIIQDAAAKAEQGGVDVLFLTANTDTTASAAYNEKLSARRAKAVQSAITAAGISASKIRMVNNAERELPVPTADNVIEPKNRVVTIVIQE